jgi:predicted nucleotidyltransferase component of viral defense system
MKKEIKDKAASVKAKLLSVSRKNKIDFDALLLRYFQEKFLYRLMLSGFSDNFILKGGFLLLCLNMPLSRPTKDIDFLARGIKNAESGFKDIFKRVAKVSCDDGVDFEPLSVFSERIIIDAHYKGIRLKINACLGKARKTLQFDIGFGNAIWPEPRFVEFPTLLEEDRGPKLKAYPVEAIVAEKFEIMLKREMMNSRMKDFYDIYSLSFSCNFESKVLKKAIENTLATRQTKVDTIPFVFREEFQNDRAKQIQWAAFLRKTRIEKVEKDFNEVTKRITDFLQPLVVSIKDKIPMEKLWSTKDGRWEDE